MVEGMLQMRLRFIPEPQAQERYLQGAVAEVLRQAQARVKRMLEQADMFKSIIGHEWLPRVSIWGVAVVCLEEQGAGEEAGDEGRDGDRRTCSRAL